MRSAKAVYAVFSRSYRKQYLKPICSIVIVVAVSGMPLGSAQATTVINFDNLATNVAVTNQYPEATFSSDPGFENRTEADYNLGTSLPNYICTAVAGGPPTCVNTTTVDFTAAVSNLTFYAGGDDTQGVTAQVEVYVNNIHTATVDVVTDGVFATPHLVDLSAYVDVTRVVIHNITDAGGLAWDDFVFDVGTVPVRSTTWGQIKSLYR